MTTARETVLQASRDFIQFALGYPIMLTVGPPPTYDTGDGVVLIAGAAGPRKAMPYCTVQIVGTARSLGRGEVKRTVVSGVPYRQLVGHRACTVQVNFYGTDADEWLELVRLAVDDALAQAAIASTGVGMTNVLAARPGMQLRDTSWEVSAQLDLECSYKVTTVVAATVAAEHIGWTITLDESINPPPDLVVTGTANI